MGKYDFEEELSDSDNDDYRLRDEIAALSAACLPSTAGEFSDDDDEDDDDDLELVRSIKEQYGSLSNPLSLEPLTTLPPIGADSDDDDDDLELVRSIKEQYGSLSNPLSLEPLTTLPPIGADSDDDDDDFETLRAIQRRFSRYCDGNGDGNGDENLDTRETKSGNCTDKSQPNDATSMPLGDESPDICRNDVAQDRCDTSGNLEGSSHTSSFPQAAQTFIEAIKKNRSCQKFIRSKLLHIEARIEEIKELQKRVKTLRDFQVQCKKKVGRALSQKQDARIQLISAPKQRTTAKGTESTVSAMCYAPPENSHVACYQDTLKKLPLSFNREKWSKEERENLEKGIIQQFQEMLLQKSTDVVSALEEPGHANGLDSIISSITNIDMTPEIIQEFSGKVNWEQLASMYLPRRSGAECEARWLNYENSLINRDNWTPMEDKQLLLLIQRNGINSWNYISEKLKTNRTPFQCLARYQRSLNASILKSDWSEDEDVQLRSAVESFGESNWQAVASAMEGRTGTQCSNRWKKTLHPTRQRVGKWSHDEDKRLKVAVALFGHKSWHRIAQFVPGRTQAQCRERWVNVLDPSVNQGEWTAEEDSKLKAAIEEHGYSWSKVATCVPTRTDNQCRRRWKKLFPHEVPLLRAARNIQKAALISNFVDRESERPALGPKDFVPLPIEGSTNLPEHGHVVQKKKKSRREEPYQTRETTPCITFEEVRSRKCRERARSRVVEMTSDCDDEAKDEGDKVFKYKKKRMTCKSGTNKKKCSGTAKEAREVKKRASKTKESKEIGEEKWDMPMKIWSRRARGVRSKATHRMSDCSVFEDTGPDDINPTTTTSENNNSKMPHDLSTCSDSQLKMGEDNEVKQSKIDHLATKEISSKRQPERSSAETTLEANSCVSLELRTSSSDSIKTCCVDADRKSKRKLTKKHHKQSQLHSEQTNEWEDMPLAVLFAGSVTCLQRKKSS